MGCHKASMKTGSEMGGGGVGGGAPIICGP